MDNLILSGFSDEISANFTEQLEVIKSLDMVYIEIRGVNGKNIADHTLEEVRGIKDQLDKAGVGISAIGSPIGKINIKEDFEPHFDLFKHVVEIAKILETRYIRLFSFFLEADQAEFHRMEVLNRMRQMVDYIEDTDLTLLHENEKDIYGDTAIRCLDLYNEMKSKQFQLIFDPANFVQCHVETYPHAYQMLKDHVKYYHIKDALWDTGAVVPAGYGDGHLKEIIFDLKKSGYKGFLSLEPHLGNFVGFAGLENHATALTFTEDSDADKFVLAHRALSQLLED